VLVDEFGHGFEFVFAELAVVVLIELGEHFFRLGHARRAARAGTTFAASALLSGLRGLVALLLRCRDSQVADFVAGCFAFFFAEFAVAVFVKLPHDFFTHFGVGPIALFGRLVILVVRHRGGGQQADRQKDEA
jgi:hypothetical protein